MSIKGPGEKPFVPPISTKEVKPEKSPEEKLAPKPAAPQPARPGIGRGPEFDAHALATRLAVLSTEAKERELKFEDIVDRVIQETGMTNPQAAMEEANRKLQREIEDALVKIKENKELMDEADSWREFGDFLSNLSEEQAGMVIGLFQKAIGAKDFGVT
ncbi:hypothetical protein HZB08_00435 [Candidatus Saganbacteria bacterium]|uniref:Uncharacterized protein n=1 Tax=Candidatus Saganbacteria bacterium TaxID=2575572 RepID=A0A9D6UNJ5_UNCSA|nr:hypothetical protein [Candidatus Saganbacteria bacterium]